MAVNGHRAFNKKMKRDGGKQDAENIESGMRDQLYTLMLLFNTKLVRLQQQPKTFPV
jgi:hypothetical protein